MYIDGSNIYHGGKDAGWKTDYGKFLDFVKRKHNIAIASYYNSTGYLQNEKREYQKDNRGKYILDDGALRFERHLKGLGVRVVSKPLKFIDGDEKNPSNKTDGDLMIDAVQEESQWERLMLLSGDCDFERLVKHIISIPKRVHVFSYESRMSYELRVQSLESPFVDFTPIDDIKSIVEYIKQ